MSTSHSRAVLSLLAVRILLPCGLKHTLEISPSCPIRIAWQAPVIELNTRAVPSAEAVTSLLPVLLYPTSRISSLCPRSVCTYSKNAVRGGYETARSLKQNHPQQPKPHLDATSTGDIPYLARSINGATNAIVSFVVKFSTGNLAMVSIQCVDAGSTSDIPNFHRVVERTL